MPRVRRRMVLIVAFAAALALATYAFTASNIVPGQRRAEFEGTISGYTVSGVAYTLASNPANVSSVDVHAGSLAATTVKAKLVQASSTYTNCSVSGGTSVTCDFSPDVYLVSADELSVVAVQ